MAGNPVASTVPGRLLLLTLFSIVFGVFVHRAAVGGPFHDLDNFFTLSPQKLQQRALGSALANSKHPIAAQSLGLDPLSTSGKAFERISHFVFVILALFQHFLGSRLGKGLLLGIAGHGFPIATFMMTEPLKPTRRTATGVLFGVAVLFLGQGMCVGAAMPILWIPYYAWLRVVEVRCSVLRSLGRGIEPLPPAGQIPSTRRLSSRPALQRGHLLLAPPQCPCCLVCPPLRFRAKHFRPLRLREPILPSLPFTLPPAHGLASHQESAWLEG